MRSMTALPAAGAGFFLSAWLTMIFAGVLTEETNIPPFGYGTAMVVTIALWLIVAPAAGAIAGSVRR